MTRATIRCGLVSTLALSTALVCGAARAQEGPAPADLTQQVEEARSAARLAVEAADAAGRARDAQAAEAIATQQALQETRDLASGVRADAARAARTLADIRNIAPDAEDAEAARLATESPRLTPGCGAGDDPGTRFDNGISSSRRCAVNYLRAGRRGGLMAGDSDWTEVLRAAEVLNDFYRARGNRQQAIVDTGSAITGTGALGAGLSAAAGPHTVLMWGYGALAGVMLVEFSGSQPTRDLYSAGHIGVGYIVNRYSVLYRSLQQLELADQPDVDRACGATGTADSSARRLAVVEAWAGGDDKTAFLPIVRRLADTCRRLRQGEGDLDAMVRRASRAADDWPTDLRTDLLSLDDKIGDRDARLRMTPSNALTAAAVGPLRLLDSLISGENTQEAVGRLRINALLDDMTVELAPVRVQTPPPTIDGVIELTPDFESRAAASGRNPPPNPVVAGAPVVPDNPAIGGMATWVREHMPLIETARRVHNDRVFYANELNEAARRSVLLFDYQVATGAAAVQLVAPGSSAQGGGGAAAKTEAPPVMPLPAD